MMKILIEFIENKLDWLEEKIREVNPIAMVVSMTSIFIVIVTVLVQIGKEQEIKYNHYRWISENLGQCEEFDNYFKELSTEKNFKVTVRDFNTLINMKNECNIKQMKNGLKNGR